MIEEAYTKISILTTNDEVWNLSPTTLGTCTKARSSSRTVCEVSQRLLLPQLSLLGDCTQRGADTSAYLIPNFPRFSTGLASTAFPPRTTIGLWISSGCAAMTCTSSASFRSLSATNCLYAGSLVRPQTCLPQQGFQFRSSEGLLQVVDCLKLDALFSQDTPDLPASASSRLVVNLNFRVHFVTSRLLIRVKLHRSSPRGVIFPL